jgi:ubiquinone/menaquinone biosynthesis C-methylase UbiE
MESTDVTQIESGLRGLLSNPLLYRLFQRAVGARRASEILAGSFIRAQSGQRILDVGCGQGAILAHLPDVVYKGIDINEAYIKVAREQWRVRGSFVVGGADMMTDFPDNSFEIVLGLGYLHHVDSEEAGKFLANAGRLLVRGGRVVTADPVYYPGQSRFARWLVSQDRGQNVRDLDAYRQLMQPYFSNYRETLVHDILHIPYTSLVMEGIRDF